MQKIGGLTGNESLSKTYGGASFNEANKVVPLQLATSEKRLHDVKGRMPWGRKGARSKKKTSRKTRNR